MTDELMVREPSHATLHTAARATRVLLLIDHLGSGGAQAILADIVSMADRGRFQFVVGYYFGSSMYTERLREAGAQVLHLGAGGGKLTAWLHALVPARLVRLVRSFEPDVVHVHTHTAPVVHTLLARLVHSRARTVFTMHANLWQLGSRWQRYLRCTLPRFDRVVTEFDGSDAEVAELRVPRTAVRHIAFGARVRAVSSDRVAAVRERCGAGQGDLLLVSVARLSPDRLLDRFIRAMPYIRASIPGTRLALVGDGTAEPELRALVADLGLEECVRFLGRAEDPMPYFHAADIYLTMSVARSCEVGIAGWQAMLCGAPVLAIEPESDGAATEWPACGFLRKVWHPDDLVPELVSLLGDRGPRESLAAAGRRHAELHQSSEAMVEAYYRLYEDLSGGHALRTDQP
ncbi:MAG TPA: glycosyltransferase [Gemmatimonadales bacterium]